MFDDRAPRRVYSAVPSIIGEFAPHVSTNCVAGMTYIRRRRIKHQCAVVTSEPNDAHYSDYYYVGGVAQWLERRSLAGDFPCPTLDLQLVDDQLCG